MFSRAVWNFLISSLSNFLKNLLVKFPIPHKPQSGLSKRSTMLILIHPHTTRITLPALTSPLPLKHRMGKLILRLPLLMSLQQTPPPKSVLKPSGLIFSIKVTPILITHGSPLMKKIWKSSKILDTQSLGK